MLGGLTALMGFSLVSEAFATGRAERYRLKKIEAALEGKAAILDPARPCSSLVADLMVSLLVTSDDTFDVDLNPSVIAEFKEKFPWVELLFEKPTQLVLGFNKLNESISKILICFKNKKPAYIFFGTPDYSENNVATKTQADPTLYRQVESCLLK
jgi:hypothetical protein